MQKGSNSPRGRTRTGTPKTIDLAPEEVKERPAAASREDAAPDSVPSPEPVAFGEKAATEAGKSRPSPGYSGFGAAGTPEAPETKDPEKSTGIESEKLSAKDSSGTGTFGRQGDAPRRDPKSDPRHEPAPATQPAAGRRDTGALALLVSAVAGGLVALALVGGLNSAGLLGHVPLLAGLAGDREAQPPVPDLTADVAALDKRIATLEEADRAAPAGSGLSTLSTALDQLTARLDEAERSITALKEAPASADTPDGQAAARLAELSSRLDAMQERLAQTAETGSDPALPALRDRIVAISESVTPLAGRIGKLEQSLGDVESRITDNTAEKRDLARKEQAAQAVAIDALQATYRRGEPFASLLSSLEELVGTSGAIDELKPFARTGVASDAELAAGFDEAASAMLATPASPDEGVIGRLLSNARSLVEVRPAEPMGGGTPQAIVSRIEASLRQGDLPSALAEWQALPDENRTASQDWGDRLQQRVTADNLLHRLLAGLEGGAGDETGNRAAQ